MMVIPELAAEPAEQWQRLRAACVKSIRQLNIPVYDGKRTPSADAPHLIVIVGGDETTRSFDPSRVYGSLQASGVAWEYGWEGSGELQPLPLSLTVGYWLLMNAKDAGILLADVAFEAIGFDTSPQECVALGQELAERAKRVAMLVMGEGSTCLTPASRRQLGDRAMQADSEVMRALGEADAAALGRFDLVRFGHATTGRAAWQVLAGAAAGRQFRGDVEAIAAPNDTQYFVANWMPMERKQA